MVVFLYILYDGGLALSVIDIFWLIEGVMKLTDLQIRLELFGCPRIDLAVMFNLNRYYHTLDRL